MVNTVPLHDAGSAVEVVGAVIMRHGTVLAAQRGSGKALAGMWEFPGGKVELGETRLEALKREILEELDCEIAIGSHIVTTTHSYEFGVVRLSTYYAFLEKRLPRQSEHHALQWVAIDKLMELAWAPADIPAARRVRAQAQEMG